MKFRKFLITVMLSGGLAGQLFAQQPTPQWRPSYHFSPDKNWTNDPNGLIFIDGVYHLYFQHNPLENKWGHMSWGHATSNDLVNWKHLPVAITEIVTPDTTTYIYSGSVVNDVKNTSGFGINRKGPMVAIFTADQPRQKRETQYIAYSNDGGLSYKQYSGNPVIDLNKRDFRDPNVFWYEPSKSWLMTVAMVDERMVRFYSSKNLRAWTKLSDFGPAGFRKGGWECPFMVPLPVDGDKSKTKWVLFVSSFGDRGPTMQYYVGDFDGTSFKNDNPEDKTLWVDNGDAFYAAIPWRLAGGKQTLMGWLINGKPETNPWKGQMTIPRDLALKTTAAGIRLVQLPAKSITANLEALSKKRVTVIKSKTLTKAKEILTGTGNHNRYWIDVTFDVSKAKEAGFLLAASENSDRYVKVGYDVATKELFIDATASEKENKSEKNLNQRVPMTLTNNILKLQILVDGSSLEVFGNDGEQVITTMIYPQEGETITSVIGEGANIKSLKIYNMEK